MTEDMLCGPISLALIARKLDREADLHAIASDVNLTDKGCSMEDLAGAAERLQLKATPWSLSTAETLLQFGESTPAIVLFRKNHFAVVWGDKDQKHLWIAEYPHPIRKVAVSEFGSDWNPRILVISQPDEPDSIFPTPISAWVFWGVAWFFGCLLIHLVFKAIRRRRDALHL